MRWESVRSEGKRREGEAGEERRLERLLRLQVKIMWRSEEICGGTFLFIF